MSSGTPTEGGTRTLPLDRFLPLEFLLVIGVAFGHGIYVSLADLLGGTYLGAGGTTDAFGADSTLDIAFWELTLFPPLLGILWLGGWRPRDFRLGVSPKSTLIALAIFVGFIVAHWVFTLLLQIFPSTSELVDTWESYKPAPTTWTAILLLTLVNPVFEEVFVAAFVIKSLHRRFGLTAAIWVSVAIRTAYHLYQGPAVIPTHIAYGLIQANVFARYGRLWPLILSHALLQILTSAQYLG